LESDHLAKQGDGN